jgi:acetyl-CoA synthetase
MPGATVAVLNEDGMPVVGSPGEIAVGRDHLNTMLRYWNQPEATDAKFRDGWLLTGDLGEMDVDGHVWFRSRTDDLINSAGYRIGPGEIEGCLGPHPAVAMAAVIGVPDERRGEVPKAFVVLRPGVEPTVTLADELRAFVRTRLAAHEAPRDIAFINELPRTTTGKIMRRALREAR